MKENTMDDVALPDWIGVTDHDRMRRDPEYSPFVMTIGGRDSGMAMGVGLELHADGNLTVDWRRLELFARMTPVDLAHSKDRDFRLGCMVRALLALRDGRVNVVENGGG